jgi:heptosyltransferase I
MQILAIRVGRVGDTVMMTPALNALLQCYPDSEVTILASPEGKRVLQNFNPRVKEIWTWNRHSLLQSWRDKKQIREKTQLACFDKIFCFDTSKRIAGLFKDVKTDFYWFQGSNILKHSARHYLDLVATSCDCNVDTFYNYLPITANSIQQVDNELEACGISKNDMLVMIHPTYSGYTKHGLTKRDAKIRKLWPSDYYGTLGKKLAATRLDNGATPKVFMEIVPSEHHYAHKIIAASQNTIQLLASKRDFERYKALIARANVLLTPDSGPMHIASALNTRIVALFSMKDPGDCGPYMPANRFTILRCDNPVKGISAISVDAVYNAAVSQLNLSSKDHKTE